MIELKNIYKSFNGNIVLNNLSLEVNSGEIYGLLGANGAGKSTTLNMLLGFLDQDSGIVNMKDNKDSTVIRKDSIGY
jgi:ABC-2 type transport system ATP-binding protein